MTAGQRVLVAAFALVVAGGGLLLAKELSPPPREKPALPPVPTAPPRPRTTPTPAAPAAPAAPRRPKPAIEVTGPDGAVVKEPTVSGDFAKAPGAAWTRIPAAGGDGVRRVRLVAAGPPVRLTVVDAEGVPAAVSCSYVHPDVVRSTDRSGELVIDDAPPGVLRIRVLDARARGPQTVLVVGRDERARVALERDWTIEGRVTDDGGRPLDVAALLVHPDGHEGPPIRTKPSDGTFRARARLEERSALRVTGLARPVTVEPTLPDPRGALVTRLEIVAPAAAAGALTLEGEDGDFQVDVEPAVLAVARDLYGLADVLGTRWVSGAFRAGRKAGLPRGIPLRVSIRGDVVPEDHVVLPADDGTTRLRIAPQPAEHTAPTTEERDPAASAFLAGTVVDGTGSPLRGVTVDAGGVRATTGADGGFRLDGLYPGLSLDLLYAWDDGADPGSANPREFEPYGIATYSPSLKPVTLVLRKAAAVSMTIVDGIDDHPLSWAHVLLSDGEGGITFDGAVATRAGKVTLDGLRVGPAGVLAVIVPGYRREVPVTLRAGETTDLGVLRLARGVRAAGVVTDAHGKPIAGASIALLAESRIKAGAGARLREHEALLRRATTDAKGEATVEGLEPGRAAGFAVWAEGFAPAVAHADPAAPGEPMRFEAKLRRGGGVVLRITDPQNAPVSGAVVDVRSAVTGARYLDLVHRAAVGTVLGSSEDVRVASALLLMEDPKVPGRYRLGPVDPGPYELEVSRPGFQPLRLPFTVPDDGDDVPATAQNEPGKVRVSTKAFGAIEWPVRLEPLAPGGR